ncbi:hypothetical protein GCM10011579_034390 [Streptomyces albiflavescens]|uniref:Uncharacterized protein n=1 Tax=Streptomyces albiflavescens TaxID=1623582 RepID=A0A917Y2B5_9ACTN|nr:hypothetical protein GCM10011579_034390 [Streptomyces albiflavescens]
MGQRPANLRRKGGLGKETPRAETPATQPAAIDPDWNCAFCGC